MNRLIKYIKPYRFLLLASLLLSILIVLSTLYVPVIVGKCIDLLIYQEVDFISLKYF